MDILTLAQLNGVSGNETAVRRYITDKIRDYVDEVTIDTMGNVIALKRGENASKTIAVTAHMDEAGFIISGITDKGYLKFRTVGNIDPRKIISKKVVVGKDVKGIIGMKAIHLQTRDEREKVVKTDKLFIDIGAKNKEDAEKRVKIGDYVAFITQTAQIGDNIKGKALDRSGACAALIDALKCDYPCDVYACFLAQHEVGARGAKIVSHRVNPDAVLTVTSVDTEDMKCKSTGGARIGDGVCVCYADRLVIPNKDLTDRMYNEAEKNELTVQKRVLKPFSSDAGAMQYNALGAKCLCAAIPCRYSHSPVSIMSTKDVDSASEYIKMFLSKIGEML